jgi:hypothetical protein
VILGTPVAFPRLILIPGDGSCLVKFMTGLGDQYCQASNHKGSRYFCSFQKSLEPGPGFLDLV